MTPAPVKPEIAVADVEKLDVRVGTVREVHDVPGSDMLMRLVVDFGDLGYADGITPVLAVPEKAVPDGTRAG